VVTHPLWGKRSRVQFRWVSGKGFYVYICCIHIDYKGKRVLSLRFEVALMYIPYTVEFINRKERIELTFKQVTYVISYSYMVDK